MNRKLERKLKKPNKTLKYGRSEHFVLITAGLLLFILILFALFTSYSENIYAANSLEYVFSLLQSAFFLVVLFLIFTLISTFFMWLGWMKFIPFIHYNFILSWAVIIISAFFLYLPAVLLEAVFENKQLLVAISVLTYEIISTIFIRHIFTANWKQSFFMSLLSLIPHFLSLIFLLKLSGGV
ncbi:hypothetical protein J4444_01570 [Candidatus Woesearchaeota archaeon]|nr:hypothetical protein [Candidatus Woesearchaeota archaeon]